MARLTHTFPALDPYAARAGGTWLVGLEADQWSALTKNNDRTRLDDLFLAKEVVDAPVVIFEGLCRPDMEGGLCYAGNPGHANVRPGVETVNSTPPGKVFCVFTTSGGKLIRWKWERADTNRPDFPEGWETRFGGIIWPKPSISSPHFATITPPVFSPPTPTTGPKKTR